MSDSLVLKRELEKIWLLNDIVWLVKRLEYSDENERGDWSQSIQILPRFGRALSLANGGNRRQTIGVRLLSHEIRGQATIRSENSKWFLEWDLAGTSKSGNGICGALAVFALISGDSDPALWCWICGSLEESEYVEATFGWWEPQRYAFSRGFPLFSARIE